MVRQRTTTTPNDEQLFQQINKVIIDEKLFLDPKFERQTIMDRFHLSKERVGAAFSKGGKYPSLANYIQQLRLEHAAHLLANHPELSITQVAADSGFSSSTYFSSCFRQYYGIRPTDFRNESATATQK